LQLIIVVHKLLLNLIYFQQVVYTLRGDGLTRVVEKILRSL
jgi:hypothetical protein